LWPAGVIGSITHATSLCAAVVAPNKLWQGIGLDVLDVHVAGHLLKDAAGLIALEEEERSARAVTPASVNPRALLFSAKESAIKAISGRLQRFVDFREILVKFEGDRFEAFCGPLGIPVSGWWYATNEQILTGSLLYRTPDGVQTRT
jgi:enterobactin synthetase component D